MSKQDLKEVAKISFGIILGICVGLFLASLFFKRSFLVAKIGKPKIIAKIHPKFSGPVDDVPAANENLEAQHEGGVFMALDENWYFKSDGVFHDSSKIFTEFRDLYNEFVNSHQKDLGELRWKVGFYYNIVGKSLSEPQVNIYFIPTLVNNRTNKAQDYHILYKKAGGDPYEKYRSGLWPEGKSYIYDQGTLFP